MFFSSHFTKNLYCFFVASLISCYLLTAQNDYWEPTSGPTGTNITVWAIGEEETILAGGYQNQILKSVDNGNSWESLGFVNNRILSIAVNEKGEIFAGSQGWGVFYSEDGGKNWETRNVGLHSNAWGNAFAFNSSGNIFLGTENGVYRSEDSGLTWQYLGRNNISVSTITINANDHIFVHYQSGFLKSEDNGNTWTIMDMNFTDRYSIRDFAVAPNDDLFLLGAEDGVYRSSDNGENWNKIENLDFKSRLKEITFNASGTIFISTENEGVFRSTDNGNNWTRINSGLASLYIDDIICANNGDLLVNSYSGIYKSTDTGDSWKYQANGYSNLRTLDLKTGNDDYLFAKTNDGVYKSGDDGNSWEPILLEPNGEMAVDSKGIIYFKNPDGIIYSADNGVSWIQIQNTPSLSLIELNNQGDIILGGVSGSHSGKSINEVYLSSDNGNIWDLIFKDTADFRIREISINNKDDIFIGTSKGGIISSNDNGETWNFLADGEILEEESIRAINFNQSGDIFIGTLGKGVFRSVDNGNNWVKINQGLQSPNEKRIVDIVFTQEGEVYIGTLGGVFRSVDNGNSWTPFIDPIYFSGVNSLTTNSSNVVFAASILELVYRTKQKTTGSNSVYGKSDFFHFHDIYPNPSSSSVIVPISIFENLRARMELFNLDGRKLTTFFEEEFVPGKYNFTFDLDKFSPGTYFLKFTSEKQVQGRILIKGK